MKLFDVIIIGGGPAGLNAAVVLGRCRRKVIVFDTGKQRNRHSNGMHNFLTRDGILPGDFLSLARREIRRYGVRISRRAIVGAEKSTKGFFIVRDATGERYYAQKLLIATGLKDNIPEIEGLEALYGKSVFHCPYCDGWEVRNKRVGIYARNKNGFELAISLLTWTDRVLLFTDGKNYLKPLEKEALQRKNIEVVSKRIKRVVAKGGRLRQVTLSNNENIACDALFFTNGYVQHCDIPKSLGCTMNNKGVVLTNRQQQGNIPGLYIAGDAARDMHFVVVAAAEGAKAAVNINKELQKADFRK